MPLYTMLGMIEERPDLFTPPSTWRPSDHADNPGWANSVADAAQPD